MNLSAFDIKNQIKTNPITFMGLVCLMLCGVFTQSDVVGVSPLFPVALVLICFLWLFAKRPGLPTVLGTMGVLVLSAIPFVYIVRSDHTAVDLLLVGIGGLCALTVYWWATKKLTWRRAILLVMALGFMLRLCYVLYTHVWVRQHDVWTFSYGEFTGLTNQRHAQYIEYIATYLELPSVNPTEVGLSQLYHPPLHHIISGLWLRLNLEMGIPYYVAYENIQLLTLFYSSACMVLVYRILRLLGCRSWGLFFPIAIIALHPTFIIMSGSINNDLLSITLSLYGIYGAIRWYKQPTFYHIFTIALAIGLAMMTKLSGGLVAVGIAVVFLWKWLGLLWQKNPLAVSMMGQFALFAAICFPLALWWPIKNAVLYDLPITFVPSLNEYSGQYLGNYTATQRWLEVPAESWERIFMAWDNEVYHSSYNEYNMFVSLMKTAVFGEFTLFTAETTPAVWETGTVWSKALFWSNLSVVFLSLYAGVRCWLARYSHPFTWCFTSIWLITMISYVQFCFSFPQACTQNFRYAVPTLICGVVAVGFHLEKSTKWFRWLSLVLIAVFGVTSIVVYGLLGTVPLQY